MFNVKHKNTVLVRIAPFKICLMQYNMHLVVVHSVIYFHLVTLLLLTLSMLGKKFSRWHFEIIFSYFFPENRL